ncbi:hypothetical protein RintRC_2139 [Richelia intracellularis]|nr:hypothetical protein RintRC_2139 [Richelia intracellularis]
MTPRSFTGLVPFTLGTGNVHYPERQDALVRSLLINQPEVTNERIRWG